jgi:lipopolysaccharide export system protein LptA
MNLQPSTFSLQLSPGRCGARWLVGALLLVGVGGVFAQANLPGVVTGYNATRYYPAPNFKQMEMKLTGAEAMQLPGATRQFRITKPVFVSFEPNGATQVTIETPECIFDETDSKARRVSSTETLAMRTGDGRFSIVGKGFLWRQEEKILIISNDVRAVIQWTNNAPPLEITSRWFEFDAERQRGVFHDDVHGEDTNQVFTCERLTVSGTVDKTKRLTVGPGVAGRGSFEMIEADGELVITGKSRPGHAKAQRGSFLQTEQRVDLVGDAEWSFNGYAGSADRMTVWMVNTNIDAVGKVKLSLPRASLGAAGGLFTTTNAPAKVTAADTNVVTLFADRFTRRGPQLLAEGAVRVNDGTNQLTCDRLEGQQATPQAPDETAIATGNVFVGREGGGIYSERAVYSKAADQVLFTGTARPRFVQGQASGTAGRIIARPTTREVRAENDVAVTLTFAADSETLLNVLPETKTNRVEKTSGTNQTVQVTARTFALRDRHAVFAGNVEARQLPADGSEPRMRCGELDIQLAVAGRRAESLQARQDVVCERGVIGVTNGPAEMIYTRMDCATLTANVSPVNGELVDLVAGGGVQLQRVALTARGEQAVYTRADQLLKLLGQSVIDSPEAVYKSRRGLSWHIATEQVVGSYDSVSFKPAALKRAEDSQKLP